MFVQFIFWNPEDLLRTFNSILHLYIASNLLAVVSHLSENSSIVFWMPAFHHSQQ